MIHWIAVDCKKTSGYVHSLHKHPRQTACRAAHLNNEQKCFLERRLESQHLLIWGSEKSDKHDGRDCLVPRSPSVSPQFRQLV